MNNCYNSSDTNESLNRTESDNAPLTSIRSQSTHSHNFINSFDKGKKGTLPLMHSSELLSSANFPSQHRGKNTLTENLSVKKSSVGVGSQTVDSDSKRHNSALDKERIYSVTKDHRDVVKDQENAEKKKH